MQTDQNTSPEMNKLFEACLDASYERCQCILSTFPDLLHSVDENGWNALHYAAKGGDVNILDLLLERGIPENSTTISKRTVLHIACLYNQEELCQYILSKFPHMLHVVDANGWNLIHFAAAAGNIYTLEFLKEKGLQVDLTTDENESILHLACSNGQFEMCQYILSKYPDVLHLIDKRGHNALHSAAMGGNIKILQFLSEQGLQVFKTNGTKMNILHISCACAHYEMSRHILTEYPDMLFSVDELGKNALHFSAQGGNKNILQFLMKNGLSANHTNDNGFAILHLACSSAKFDMCQYILTKCPYLLHWKTKGGWNAAHCAAYGGNVNILKLLLKKGIQAYERTSKQENILHIACTRAQLEICRYILSEYPGMLLSVDECQHSAAHSSAIGGNVQILHLLIEKGLPANITAKTKLTILHVACGKGRYEMCQYIIENIPDILHSVTEDKWNATHFAAGGGNVKILKMLIAKGVPPKHVTRHGLNILHIACISAEFEMCKFILSKYPFMLFKRCNTGYDVSSYAEQGGDVRIMQLLKSRT